MNEDQAKEMANTVVEELYRMGKIPESIYGNMTMDGDGDDVTRIAKAIVQPWEAWG